MSYITKFQAIYYYGVKDKNKVMKKNCIDVKYYVEKDFNGDWILKKETSKSNLPDKLLEFKKAKFALKQAYDLIKIERAHWDNIYDNN